MIRVLDVAERDRVWRSTLSKALFRWSHDLGVADEGVLAGWEVKTAVADWHPVWPYTTVVHARPNEYFEVVE